MRIKDMRRTKLKK
jgi:hypothetical protein